VCLLVVASACSSGGGEHDAGVDSGVKDAGCDASKLPTPNDPCLVGLGCGNVKWVGRACTKGGGQCGMVDDLELAHFCTADYSSATDPAFCTRPCTTPDACGPGAVCQGDPSDPNSAKGCVPVSCATPTDGGTCDGGTDAGTDGGC
jgi:hypothetical protein